MNFPVLLLIACVLIFGAVMFLVGKRRGMTDADRAGRAGDLTAPPRNLAARVAAPLPSPAPAAAETGATASLLVDRARDLLRAGKKIEAVKLVKDSTGWGLAQSVQYVEGLERRL
jgi:hypothetical protein